MLRGFILASLSSELELLLKMNYVVCVSFIVLFFGPPTSKDDEMPNHFFPFSHQHEKESWKQHRGKISTEN